MAEPGSATPSPSKTIRDRSPSFPFIPLKTAIERLEAFEKKFGRHPTPAAKAGLAWGMKEKSSQGDQTLAALKSFGLIKYDGMGASRHVSLTDEGRNYLRAQQDKVKKEILKACALRPKNIRKFWAVWQADRPPDEVALDKLVLQDRFSDGGARAFLKIYDDTISFAGLSSSDKMPDLSDDGDDGSDGETEADDVLAKVAIGDLVQVEINGAFQLQKPTRVRAIRDHEGEKWVFIEGSETGIRMNQVRVEQKGSADKPPPTLPEEVAVCATTGEREWLRGPLSRETSYRLIVSGDLGPREIGKLIKLLKAQQAVLSDEDGDEGDEAAN